ncbi:amidohydrolase family protein [Desulfovibrio gilichinskyi]|uniref:5-methylthioadenosine/S-adenosylhomocysteine deaminase n=1 Tax=Desulfovibrio gilichinskyi TaxID=1519643 RepID=A0A1X7C794_9BACT|nr:amidohydrolase [Desulfovibrio gilichinskyi]SME91358.1 5-methylthioadenosine/S-adenosylhomocysteine deaminase [Desulfovibrio gilichinskyi]
MSPQKCDLIIYGSNILTQDENRSILTDGAIAVTGKIIADVGTKADIDLKWNSSKTLDVGNSIIMPGMINSHTHVPMTLMRGVADDLPLLTWLHEYIFPIEAGLNKELVELGALLGCAEMIAGGTTAFLDGYMFEDVVGKAVDESGIKAVLGEGFFEFPSPFFKTAKQAWETIEGLHERFLLHDRITTSITPHAVFTTTPDQLIESMELAEKLDVLWQIHCAESVAETELTSKKFDKRPLEVLCDNGLLTPRTRIHHCVDVTEQEIKQISASGAMISHNPQSNLKLGSGICPLTKLLSSGITVGLGTDGAASNNDLNMFEEMRTASLLQKGILQDPTAIPAQTALDLATVNGAKFLGLTDTGIIKAGMRADIIAIDMDKLHLKPVYNPLSHIVYSAGAQDVNLTICDGKVLYQNGKHFTCDVETISHEAEKAVKWALSRLKKH